MHKLDQPQTTNTSKVRDAAAQISSADKAELMMKGLRKKHGSSATSYAMDSGALAWIAAALTSINKDDREHAKKMVHELVKLGKEQA